MTGAREIGAKAVIDRDGLDALILALARREYRVIGPTVRDGTIQYDDIAGVADLPQGWADRQDGGAYRLERRGDAALFGYATTAQAWKRFLHPPSAHLWRAERHGDGFVVSAPADGVEKFAFLGVRSCDLRAIAIQDQVLREGTYIDPDYAARRDSAFVVAVNCGQAGGTCFCLSMGTGPAVGAGFDLALTELLDGGPHRLLVEIGTASGASLLSEIACRPPETADEAAAAAAIARAAAEMGRAMPAADEVPDLLRRNLDHPRWDAVAERCLTCGNCTMVCPTCFCTTVEDTVSLDGAAAERTRHWDSCFTTDFTHLHGGSVRASSRSRYRQWMTHKLSTWVDQFGTSGCVGCGRCITWCPVGIDITEEVAAIRADSVVTSRAGGT
jgi:sulfhydrogenase subunit beta (sulfur reductase)